MSGSNSERIEVGDGFEVEEVIPYMCNPINMGAAQAGSSGLIGSLATKTKIEAITAKHLASSGKAIPQSGHHCTADRDNSWGLGPMTGW